MLMFLRQAKNKKTGRTYLSIVHGYRDKESKKSRTKTIKSLGYLDELEKEHDDPIAFFEENVRKMNEQQTLEKFSVTFRFHSDERIQSDTTNRKNFGYAALSKIYHDLGLHTFLINRQRHSKEKYNSNNN